MARIAATRVGLTDQPDETRKLHSTSTPLMGGVAVYLTLLCTLGVVWGLGLGSLIQGGEANTNWLALLASAGMMCVLGLWDDRFGMNARTKLLGQLVACVPYVVWARTIDTVTLLDNGLHLHLGHWGVLFTVFWLVTCTNAVNLMDGLDGLAAMIGVIICVTLGMLSGVLGNTSVMLVSIVVAGSLTGFLIHNWPPAKVFMGDSGSLTIGFLVGALSLEANLKQATGVTLIVPLVLVSIPAYDTFMAIVRRRLTGKEIGKGDLGHIHHRLRERGLTDLQVLLVLSALCLVMSLIAIASVYARSDLVAVIGCVAMLVLLVVGRVFGHYEMGLIVGNLRAFGRRVAANAQILSARPLIARLRGTAMGDVSAQITERQLDGLPRFSDTSGQYQATEEPAVPDGWIIQFPASRVSHSIDHRTAASPEDQEQLKRAA